MRKICQFHAIAIWIFFQDDAIGFSVHNPPGFQGIHQWHVPFEEKGKDILPLSDKPDKLFMG